MTEKTGLMEVDKVLITGGCGFIGHHIVEHFLKNTTFEVIILDSVNYAGNLNRLPDINIFEYEKHRIKFVYHDLRSPINEGVDAKIGKVDYILHLAAETHVDRSLKDAIPFVLSNAVGTTNLLEWVKHRQVDIRKMIAFSTDEVYGPAPKGIFFPEWSTMLPSNPYAASKGAGDLMAYSFAHAFGLPIAITRCMNVIGERQNKEKFVPKTIKAILEGKKITIHGKNKNYTSSRCWIHARNVADALLFLLDRAKREEMYHIVGEERSVLDIANIINKAIKGKELVEKDVEFVNFHLARPGHDERYALNGTRMEEMGWHPPIDLEHSLIKTVDWTRKNLEWIK